jgi:hypothetical protein
MEYNNHFLSLLENEKAAKNLLLKKYAEDNGKQINEIPEEIKKSILDDPRFQKILDLCKKNNKLGWVYVLTKFHIIDDIPWESFVAPPNETPGVFDLLKSLNIKGSELPLNNLDAYARVIPSAKDERPGFEVLLDDLTLLQNQREVNKLFAEFIPRMKEEFRKTSQSKEKEDKNLIDSIFNSSKIMSTLKPRRALQKDGSYITEYPFEEFKKMRGRYSDGPGNLEARPQFKDPKVAFRAMVDDLSNLVDSWGLSLDETTQKLIGKGPQAGIFFTKMGYLAMSARTPEAQKVVSGDSGFCINNPSTFFNYSDGAIQVNILNGNLPKANKKSLLGITIKPDGTVKNCAWRTNTGGDRDFQKGGINYVDFLKELDYPEELIATIIENFEEELNIKSAVEIFYKNFDSSSTEKIITELFRIKGSVLSGKMDDDEWERISSIVTYLIKEEKGIKPTDFIDKFKESGIYSPEAWETFSYVIGDDYTKEDMEEIKASTMDQYSYMEEMVASPEVAEKYFGKEYVSLWKEKLKYKDETLRKMDSLIDLK